MSKLTQEQIAAFPEERIVAYTVRHVGSESTTDVKWLKPGRKELKNWREAYRQGGEDIARETLVMIMCVSHDDVELFKLLEMRPALEKYVYADLLSVLDEGVERTKKASSPAAT